MSVLTKTNSGHLHKCFKSLETKVLDESLGIVEAVVSVTNVLDDVGDVIEAGAYADTLRKRTPKGVWAHDWDVPVAKTLDIVELMPGDPRLHSKIQALGGGGLKVTMQFNMATQRGREAFADVQFFGELSEWSIGYIVPADGSRIDPKTGIRYINKIELFEYSPVLFGANPHTATMSVKSLYNTLTERLIKAGVTEIPGLMELLEAGCGLDEDGNLICETKKGRYDIRKQGDQYCVYNVNTGENMPGGCHESRGQAEEHMRALYVNVPEARDDGKSVVPCGCDETHDCGCGNKQIQGGFPLIGSGNLIRGDEDEHRVTEPHVFHASYGDPGKCSICLGDENDSLHVENMTIKDAAPNSDPGDTSAQHVYSPAGGPNSGAPDQPCLVCGRVQDDPIHIKAEQEVTVEVVPNDTATDVRFNPADPTKTCSGTWTVKIAGYESNPAPCARPQGHKGICGPLFKETPPLAPDLHDYDEMQGPDGPICAFCGNAENHPYHQTFDNTNSGRDANPVNDPPNWGKSKESDVGVCGKSLNDERPEEICTKDAGHEGNCAVEFKAAVRSHSTATVDSAWDGPGQEAKLDEVNTSIGNDMFAWRDSDGDPTNKSSWKFPHHMVSDGKPGSANMAACSAIIASLNGGRGGAKIPSGNRQGVYNHAAKHLKDGGKDVPDLKSWSSDADMLREAISEVAIELLVENLDDETRKELVAENNALVKQLQEILVKVVPPKVDKKEIIRAGIEAMLKAAATSDATDAVGQLKDGIAKIDSIVDELMAHLGIPDPDEDEKNENEDEDKRVAAPETKVDVPLMGSFEQIYSQINASLEANPPGGTAADSQMITWIEATYPDHVLVCATEVRIGESDDDDSWLSMPPIEILGQRYLSYPYSMVEGSVQLGDPTEVSISAVVAPKAADQPVDMKTIESAGFIDKTATKVSDFLQSKVGRTLSAANAEAIRGAVLSLIDVLAKAGVEISAPGGEDQEDEDQSKSALSPLEVMKYKLARLTA